MPAYNMALRLLVATSDLVNQAAAATLTILHQPPTGGCYIKYYVAGGTAGSGTITVIGTVGGVAGITEIITFTGNRWILGTKLFTAISGAVTTGLADEATPPTVRLEAVNSGGNPLGWSVEYGPYAVSARRIKSNSQVMRDMAEGRNSQDLYYIQTDEEGIDASPGQRFTIDEHPGLTFEVWSDQQNVPVVSGDVILKREFYAREISPG